MEFRTERVLGGEKARIVATSLLHDIEHSLKQKELHQFEFLKRSVRKIGEFERFARMDSTERIEELAKGDVQTAREVIMAEGLRLYLERLEAE